MLSFPPLVHKYLVVLQVILGSLVVITASATTDVGSFPRNVHWNNENLEEMEMVERKGNQFVVGGQPFYVNGFNTYWLMILGADSSTRGKVTETFAAAAAVGLTVGRTWAFNDGGWRALQISPSVYDEVVFKALDFVVSEAKNHNVRLILSLANNWEAYGGKAQYIKWGKVVGLNLTSDDDFFIDPTMKGYYKSHVKTILNRVNTYTNITYKDDPIIFAWELMNEPRCITDPTGNKLQSWIEEMTFYVKSIDPKHLVCVGLEGFYGSSTPDRLLLNPNVFASQVGTDFIRNHQTLGIDFATAHIYPDTWLTNTISNEYLYFIELWIQSHIDDAENVLGMPVIFSEFGVSSKDVNFTNEFRDRFIDTVYKKIMNSTRRGGGGGGCLLWQLFPEGVDYMDDGYAVVLPKAESTSTIISLQSKRTQIFNTKCSWKCHWGCKKRNSQVVKSHHNMEL